ncbi:MAG: hypothetical protein ACR5LF_13475 [Symbiopectobacterium sp.]
MQHHGHLLFDIISYLYLYQCLFAPLYKGIADKRRHLNHKVQRQIISVFRQKGMKFILFSQR